MAEASWLKKAPSAPAVESDEDPFAELTRIMGFDPRVPFKGANDETAANVDLSEDDLDLSADLERELIGSLEAEAAHLVQEPVSHSYAEEHQRAPEDAVQDVESLHADVAAPAEDWSAPAENVDVSSQYSSNQYHAGYESEYGGQEAETSEWDEDYSPEDERLSDTAHESLSGEQAYSYAEDEQAHLVYGEEQEEVGGEEALPYETAFSEEFEDELPSEAAGWQDEDEEIEEARYSAPLHTAYEPEVDEADEFVDDFETAMAEVDMNFAADSGDARPYAPAAAFEPTAEVSPQAERNQADPDMEFDADFGSALADELDQIAELDERPMEHDAHHFEAAPSAAVADAETGPVDEAEAENARQSEIDEAIAELAAMVRGYDRPEQGAAPAIPEERPSAGAAPRIVQDAPEIETIEVPEHTVALADDLDIPDIDYEDDNVPHFDELEAELAAAFGEPAMEAATPVSAAEREMEPDEADASYESYYDEPDYGAASYGAAASAAAVSAGYASRGAMAQDGARAAQGGMTPEQGDSYEFQVDPDLDEQLSLDEEFVPLREPVARRRGMMVAAAVSGIAILGALGAYALSGGSGVSSAEPALVRADTDPIKVKPENPGGAVVPNQDSVVFDRASGETPSQPQQETLISNDVTPVDVAERFPETSSEMPDGSAGLGGQGESLEKTEDRIEQGDASGAAEEVAVVAPRKVRTMIVKSDGTLVPREDVEPEVVAAVSDSAARSLTDPALSSALPRDEVVSTGATASTQRGASAPSAREASSSRMPDSVPVAPSRPGDQPVDIVGEVKSDQVASVEPAVEAPPPGSWSMQIASQPSEAAAQASYQDLARRYAGVLGGRAANIVKADIAGKGTFWRVRIPAGGRSDAINLCETYKAAGGNCFVAR